MHHDMARSRLVWDGVITRFGGTGLLRKPGLADRLVSYTWGSLSPQERLGQIANPNDMKVLVSAIDPTTGQVLSPEPSEQDVLVIDDELLKIVAPPDSIGPNNTTLYWVLLVRG